MASRRRIIDDRLYAHFVTFSVVRRRRLLDHDHPKRIVLGVLNEELDERDARCFGFVVMPDQVHAILWFPATGQLSRFMHENPVRAGLAKHPTDWKWSSARWYACRKSVRVPIHWVD